ncbi:MAG: Fe-S-containing protein [Spirochaetales bacterium]|jgi:uncharacterized membrane protein|nr:Fe-S-containing protein [Spirochaetales bacterium]
MLKYLIQVVQNLLSPAILAALIFGFGYKGGGPARKKFFATGAAAGGTLALILAVLRRVTRLINREYFNTGILCISIIAGILFIIFIIRRGTRAALLPGGEYQDQTKEKFFNTISAVLLGSLFFYALPTIFLYPTEFALPGESIFSTDFLFKLTGYLCGLGLVLFTSLALFHVTSGLDIRLASVLLAIGLAVNMFNQIATIVQFLLARRIIPIPRRLFGIIILIINYNDFFLYALMTLTFLLPVILYIKSLRPAQTYANPAEHRKIKAAMRRHKRWSAGVAAGYIFTVISLTALKAWDEQEVVLSPAEPITIAGGEIILAGETIQDGHLHRYMYTAQDATEMRFIVIRKNTASYGVGLDACAICGPTGYYERDNEVICKLCDVVMNISTIGFPGGCNPVPLAYTLRGGNMVIKIEDLEKEKTRFK